MHHCSAQLKIFSLVWQDEAQASGLKWFHFDKSRIQTTPWTNFLLPRTLPTRWTPYQRSSYENVKTDGKNLRPRRAKEGIEGSLLQSEGVKFYLRSKSKLVLPTSNLEVKRDANYLIFFLVFGINWNKYGCNIQVTWGKGSNRYQQQ